MKTIGLKEACNRLKKSVAVIVENSDLMYMGDIYPEEINREDGRFLFLGWGYFKHDGDYGPEETAKKYELVFASKDNQSVKVSDDGSLMYLVEEKHGYKLQLTLLVPAEIK